MYNFKIFNDEVEDLLVMASWRLPENNRENPEREL
jgi:hypothetical protein